MNNRKTHPLRGGNFKSDSLEGVSNPLQTEELKYPGLKAQVSPIWMNLILFGFKGCGKTYYGKKLAQDLQWTFIDTDELIVELYGQKLTPRAIYEAIGEIEFRRLETQAILSLKEANTSVIALGGGSVLNPDNVTFLQNLGQLIYLEASLETIKARGTTLAAGPLEELYWERLPLYRAINAIRIPVDSNRYRASSLNKF